MSWLARLNPYRGLGGLPRGVWILGLATLINRSGTMALPFLALFVTDGLKESPSVAGAVLATYGAAAFATGPIAGRLIDRMGALFVIRFSLLSSGCVLLLFSLAHSLAAVIALVIAFAMTSEMLRPASHVMAAEIAGPEHRKQSFAVNRLAINLGMSIGPVIGGLLASVSFGALFAVDGLTSLAAGVLLFLVPPVAVAPAPRADAAAIARDGFFSPLRDRRFLLFLLAVIPIGVVFFQLESAMPLYMVKHLHFEKHVYGMMFTVNTLLIVAVEVPVNLRTAHWSHRRTLTVGSLLVAVGFGSMAFADTVPEIAATVVVWTFGEMVLFPGMTAYVSDLAPPDRRGRYMGLYTTAFAMAFTFGPWIGARILDRFGGVAVWLTMLVLGLAAAAMMARVASSTAPSARAA